MTELPEPDACYADGVARWGDPPCMPYSAPIDPVPSRNGRGPLWHNANDKPVSGPNVGYAINKHLSRLGIEDTSHGLRRWFGEHAHELTGNDVRTVQEMLGHADPRTTMRYIRPDARRRGDVADQLAARLTRRSAS